MCASDLTFNLQQLDRRRNGLCSLWSQLGQLIKPLCLVADSSPTTTDALRQCTEPAFCRFRMQHDKKKDQAGYWFVAIFLCKSQLCSSDQPAISLDVQMCRGSKCRCQVSAVMSALLSCRYSISQEMSKSKLQVVRHSFCLGTTLESHQTASYPTGRAQLLWHRITCCGIDSQH